MSFEELVLDGHQKDYGFADTAQAIEELPHGLRITKGELVFTVPWASVKFTMGPMEALRWPELTPEQRTPEFVAKVNQEFQAAMKRVTPLLRKLPEAVEDFKPELLNPAEASRSAEFFARGPPDRRAKPCPVCDKPNRRAFASYLCEEHTTEENKALFRRGLK